MRRSIAATVVAALMSIAASPAAVAAGTTSSLVTGAIAAFVLKKERNALPELAFKDDKGNVLSLADWQGRVVLINLWATWCAPCRAEMPSLNALQQRLGGDDFEVVAISVDRKGVEASGQFLSVTGAKDLKLYVDESFKVARDLKAPGLPVSILVDRQGREVGRVTGPAEWDSDEAVALIRSVIEDKAAAR